MSFDPASLEMSVSLKDNPIELTVGSRINVVEHDKERVFLQFLKRTLSRLDDYQ